MQKEHIACIFQCIVQWWYFMGPVVLQVILVALDL